MPFPIQPPERFENEDIACAYVQEQFRDGRITAHEALCNLQFYIKYFNRKEK